MNGGSWVGLDVHARSVVGGVIDVGSGEVRSLRVSPECDATVAWLKTLPAPVRVVYEAGPTGYRLARACADVPGTSPAPGCSISGQRPCLQARVFGTDRVGMVKTSQRQRQRRFGDGNSAGGQLSTWSIPSLTQAWCAGRTDWRPYGFYERLHSVREPPLVGPTSRS